MIKSWTAGWAVHVAGIEEKKREYKIPRRYLIQKNGPKQARYPLMPNGYYMYPML
jgi:hypothetical protein